MGLRPFPWCVAIRIEICHDLVGLVRIVLGAILDLDLHLERLVLQEVRIIQHGEPGYLKEVPKLRPADIDSLLRWIGDRDVREELPLLELRVPDDRELHPYILAIPVPGCLEVRISDLDLIGAGGNRFESDIRAARKLV